jgi:hypothetical protein
MGWSYSRLGIGCGCVSTSGLRIASSFPFDSKPGAKRFHKRCLRSRVPPFALHDFPLPIVVTAIAFTTSWNRDIIAPRQQILVGKALALRDAASG